MSFSLCEEKREKERLRRWLGCGQVLQGFVFYTYDPAASPKRDVGRKLCMKPVKNDKRAVNNKVKSSDVVCLIVKNQSCENTCHVGRRKVPEGCVLKWKIRSRLNRQGMHQRELALFVTLFALHFSLSLVPPRNTHGSAVFTQLVSHSPAPTLFFDSLNEISQCLLTPQWRKNMWRSGILSL